MYAKKWLKILGKLNQLEEPDSRSLSPSLNANTDKDARKDIISVWP